MDVEKLDSVYEANKTRYIAELSKYLEFKSVATDPEYKKETLECADWLKAHLSDLGFTTKLLDTPGFPVLYAEYVPEDSKGVVSFYGHYDVQPVDPIELWESDPFIPEVRDGRIYARGAQDNKGQTFYVIKALETLIEAKLLNYTVRMFIEGEEESQSTGISQAMGDWKDILASDLMLVCDTGTRSKDILSITMGLRGVASLTVELKGPNKDLHSGVHGGVAPNPAAGICKLLASLYNSDGSVAVEGFYDQVVDLPKEDLEIAELATIPPELYEQMVGVPPVGGEDGLSFPVRRGVRPTLEINGVHSGYGGAGSKTIIPSKSLAKITCRTVKNQVGKNIIKLIEDHLVKHTPKGLTLEITEKGAEGAPLSVSAGSKAISKARQALETLDAGPVELMWEGASIPIVADLSILAEADPVLVGFGLEEDNIHAPNESFSLDQFKKGFLFAGLFFQDCL